MHTYVCGHALNLFMAAFWLERNLEPGRRRVYTCIYAVAVSQDIEYRCSVSIEQTTVCQGVSDNACLSLVPACLLACVCVSHCSNEAIDNKTDTHSGTRVQRWPEPRGDSEPEGYKDDYHKTDACAARPLLFEGPLPG